ncbi:MAG: glycosidase, partial [Chloroflexota bacterium]|nr:glycosidase [Chloroflexota bacterium]
MESNADDPLEAGGVLNPASARAPDGQLYLFPRLVADGNYSRIGIARVGFNGAGDPVSVERLGLALEPTEPYEKNDVTGGGCEDPRISYVACLERYVMTYTALSPVGPRIAVAVSQDLLRWERLGLVRFAADETIQLEDAIDNKDAMLFPSPVIDPRTG